MAPNELNRTAVPATSQPAPTADADEIPEGVLMALGLGFGAGVGLILSALVGMAFFVIATLGGLILGLIGEHQNRHGLLAWLRRKTREMRDKAAATTTPDPTQTQRAIDATTDPQRQADLSVAVGDAKKTVEPTTLDSKSEAARTLEQSPAPIPEPLQTSAETGGDGVVSADRPEKHADGQPELPRQQAAAEHSEKAPERHAERPTPVIEPELVADSKANLAADLAPETPPAPAVEAPPKRESESADADEAVAEASDKSEAAIAPKAEPETAGETEAPTAAAEPEPKAELHAPEPEPESKAESTAAANDSAETPSESEGTESVSESASASERDEDKPAV